MLKKRLVAVLPIKNGVVVQSIGFERYLPIGRPDIAVDFLNRWGIDEIVLLDIDASAQGRSIDPELVRGASRVNFVPLTVGGGIRSTCEMKALLAAGADKISINLAAISDSELIKRGAEMFGNQCIIVSMDVRASGNGKYEVFSDSGARATGLDPFNYAKEVERLGAGEIFLTSIDRDGRKLGYDLKLAELISDAVNIPVIICGGVGHPQHFVDGMRIANISGVAAGNFFQFSEHSPVAAKSFIQKNGFSNLRLDTYATYRENHFDGDGRLARKTESELESLFFEFHPKEVI